VTSQADALRAALVDRLLTHRWIVSRTVEAAFRAVPRHAFLPGLPLEEVYADRSIAIKLEDGVPISSSSQPAIMAVMLELLRTQPGERVLEIGTGSGYNAALLATLLGPRGRVTTIDLDGDLVAAARARLDAAGFGAVRTRVGDGALGVPDDGPYDAAVATVAVGGVPAAWHAQLRAGARLVMPLSVGLNQKVVAFEREPDRFVSTATVEASFMTLRGPSAALTGATVALGDEAIVLNVLDPRAVDAAALARTLREPYQDVAPARPLARDEVLSGFAFWLGARDERFCHLTAYGEAATRGAVPGLSFDASAYGHAGTLGVCAGDELAVFTVNDEHEPAIRRFGPDRGAVARVQRALIAWDEAGRPGSERLRIEAVQRAGAAWLDLRVSWR
jgi:protein-L-isoaspartate(D-aspartate) O-methyltransferase